ncbi:MAG: hypothetical protein KGM47_17610 [Acidobacteriota bacterium]|nr:hypothetical protein [Acidobacteriota bacterium]
MSLTARLKRIQQHLDDLSQLDIDRRLDELLRSEKYQDPKRLARFGHKAFSQSGEDGILAEIFRRIGTTNRIFAECSPGDGLENNTLYLLTLGWKGCWIERNPALVKSIKRAMAGKIEAGSLSLQQAGATAENIEALLSNAGLPAEFDLLSIDIDGNDYWLWRKIERYRPRVVVIEYNPIFPPDCEWVMEYKPGAVWDKTSNSGASLLALERLGARKGYYLVGCTLAGTNAFFVRDDLAGELFRKPFTAQNHYEPPRYYLTSRRAGHKRSPSWGWTETPG